MKFAVACLCLVSVCATSLASTPWKFIVTGDSRGGDNGVNTAILSEIACEIVDHQVEFVLFPGDLVNGSTNSSLLASQLTTWRNTMQPVYDAGIGVHVVRGNHDAGSITAWNAVFPELPDNGPAGEQNLTYSLGHRNAFITAVDQYISYHRVNQAWLDDQLSANTNPHVFVFGHAPAFKVGHWDCLDDYVTNRDAFWSSIEAAGGRTYFAGHDHFYNHAVIDHDGDLANDIHQYVVGTAGAPLYGWAGQYDGNNSNYVVTSVDHASQYGYVLVEIDGLDVTLTWMQRQSAGLYVPDDQWSYTAVPEPAALTLFGICAVILTRRNACTVR